MYCTLLLGFWVILFSTLKGRMTLMQNVTRWQHSILHADKHVMPTSVLSALRLSYTKVSLPFCWASLPAVVEAGISNDVSSLSSGVHDKVCVVLEWLK